MQNPSTQDRLEGSDGLKKAFIFINHNEDGKIFVFLRKDSCPQKCFEFLVKYAFSPSSVDISTIEYLSEQNNLISYQQLRANQTYRIMLLLTGNKNQYTSKEKRYYLELLQEGNIVNILLMEEYRRCLEL